MCSVRARLCFRYKTCTTLQSWYLRKHLSWRNFQILDLRRTCPLMTHPHHKVLCHFQYWRKQKCGKREKNMNRVPCGCWLYRWCVPQPPDTNFACKFKFETFCVAASTLSTYIHFHDIWSVVSDFAGIVLCYSLGLDEQFRFGDSPPTLCFGGTDYWRELRENSVVK